MCGNWWCGAAGAGAGAVSATIDLLQEKKEKGVSIRKYIL